MAQIIVGVKANQVSSKNTFYNIHTLRKDGQHLQQLWKCLDCVCRIIYGRISVTAKSGGWFNPFVVQPACTVLTTGHDAQHSCSLDWEPASYDGNGVCRKKASMWSQAKCTKLCKLKGIKACGVRLPIKSMPSELGGFHGTLEVIFKNKVGNKMRTQYYQYIICHIIYIYILIHINIYIYLPVCSFSSKRGRVCTCQMCQFVAKELYAACCWAQPG